MKRILSLSVILLVVVNTVAQSESPALAWKRHDIPPVIVNNPLVSPSLGYCLTPGGPNTYDGSGEDWWYDIVNIYESGEHVGYMACGFATWLNLDFNETNVTGGCSDFTSTGISCDRPVIDGQRISSKPGTIARYDLNGNMVWCKAYVLAKEGFYAISPTSDGNFVVIGWGRGSLDLQGNPLMYNPGTSDYLLNSDCGIIDKSRMIGAKVDPNGNLLWINTYGYYETTDDPESALDKSVIGADVVEKNTGGFRFVGYTQTDGEPNLLQKTLVIDTDNEGIVSSKALFGDNGLNHESRAIEKDATGYYITIAELNPNTEITNFVSGDGILLKLDEDLNQIDFGSGTYDGGNAVRIEHDPTEEFQRNIPHDVIVTKEGNIVWTVIENCNACLTSGNNFGELNIYINDPSSGSEINVIDIKEVNSFGFENVHAFDLKAGLVASEDGGFAAISGFQTAIADLSSEPYASILTDLDSKIAFSCLDGVLGDFPLSDEILTGFWDTDAYVAKFDASGNLIWDKSFDADDAIKENYPGDFKEQECVYRLTEAQDGSLIFVGNTSHNKDDYYIAKIQSDCSFNQPNFIEGELDTDNTCEVLGDEIWSSTTLGTTLVEVAGKIKIKAGASLTIENIIVQFGDSRKMPFETKLIVEPGGELVINEGAVLSSYSGCENTMWDGIEIWGNAALSQTPEEQGMLIMNGGTIENAIIGVSCVKRDGFEADLTTTGGFFFIDNALFQNNLVGIEMRPYEDLDGAVENLSTVNRTTFEINEPLNDIELANVSVVVDPENGLRETVARAHQEFILIEGINGLKVRGNSFTLVDAIKDDYVDFRKGFGILSLDSKLIVEPYFAFDGDPDPIRNVFANNWIGINSKIKTDVNRNQIDRVDFDRNHIGVAIEGSSSFSTIINNQFMIEEEPGILENASIGIYVNGSTALTIENNNFDGLIQTIGATNAGVYVENSSLFGSAEIYRNHFDKLDVIIQTNGDNSSLEVDCNIFNNDISADDQIVWHNRSEGIVANQGNCTIIAGTLPEAPHANRFLGTYDSDNLAIFNEGLSFEYNSYDVSEYELPFNLGVINETCADEITIDSSLACPQRNEDAIFLITIEDEITELQNQLKSLNKVLNIIHVEEKESLKHSIDYLNSSIARRVDKAVKNYLLQNDFKNAIRLYEKENTLRSTCALLPLLSSIGDQERVNKHLSKVEEMLERVELTDKKRLTIEDVYSFYELMKEIKLEGGLTNMSNSQLESLMLIKEQHSSMEITAENILESLYQSQIELPHVYNIELRQNSNAEEKILKEETINQMYVYPNPANDRVNILYSHKAESYELKLYLYTITGELVLSQEIYEGVGEIELNVDKFNSGVYLISLVGNSSKIVEKLIIE